MFDFALFLWKIAVAVCSIICNNPWLGIVGEAVTYVLQKVYEWLSKDESDYPFTSPPKTLAKQAKKWYNGSGKGVLTDEKSETQGKAAELHGVCGEVFDGRGLPAAGVRGAVAGGLRLSKMRRDKVLFSGDTKRIPMQQMQAQNLAEGGYFDGEKSAALQNLAVGDLPGCR
jgi:hypothetical protein